MSVMKKTKVAIISSAVFLLIVAVLIIVGLMNNDKVKPTLELRDDFSYNYFIDSDVPDWSSAISYVSDNKSTLLTSDVVVDASQVDMTKTGVYKVFFNVSDEAGNELVKEISISVSLPDKPAINLKAGFEFVLNINEEKPEWISAIDSITDNKDIIGVSEVIVDDSSVDLSKAGNYVIILKIIDSDRFETEKEVTVTVVDKENPVIILDEDFIKTYQVGSPEPDWTRAVLSMEDNTDNSTLTLTYETDISMSVIGMSNVIFTVTDTSGNKSTETIEVEIEDTIEPEFTLSKLFQTRYHVGDSTPVWINAIDSVSDNYDTLTLNSVSIDDSKVDLDNPGLYEVAFELEDSSGNTVSKYLNVMVGFYANFEDYFVGNSIHLFDSFNVGGNERILLMIDYSKLSSSFEIHETYIFRLDELGNVIWSSTIENGEYICDHFIVGDNLLIVKEAGDNYDTLYESYSLTDGSKNSAEILSFCEYSQNSLANKFEDGSFLIEVYTSSTEADIYKFNVDGSFTMIKENTLMTRDDMSSSLELEGYNYSFWDLDTGTIVVNSFNELGESINEYIFGVKDDLYSGARPVDQSNYYIATSKDGIYTLHFVNTDTGLVDLHEVEYGSFIGYDYLLRTYESGEKLVFRNEDSSYYVSIIDSNNDLIDISPAYSYISHDLVFDDLGHLTLYVVENSIHKVVKINKSGDYIEEIIVGNDTDTEGISYSIVDESHLITNYLDELSNNKTIIITLSDFSYVIYDELMTSYSKTNSKVDGDKMYINNYVYNGTTADYDVTAFVLGVDESQAYLTYQKTVLRTHELGILSYTNDYTYLVYKNSVDGYHVVKHNNDTMVAEKDWVLGAMYIDYYSGLIELSDGSVIVYREDDGLYLGFDEIYSEEVIYVDSKEIGEITYHIVLKELEGNDEERTLCVYADDGTSVEVFNQSETLMSYYFVFGQILDFTVNGDGSYLRLAYGFDLMITVITITNLDTIEYDSYYKHSNGFYQVLEDESIFKQAPLDLQTLLEQYDFTNEVGYD